MIKRLLIPFLVLVMVFCSAYRKPYKYTILAEKDAYYHNNLGLNYLNDRAYVPAIQEFKIAISLSPTTQASAIFYNNLGETYTFIGYPEAARICFEDALRFYGLNFKYYKNLINCYISLGIVNSKTEEFKNSENIYDKLKLGLLYAETGQVRKGINILDEFCATEPDLIITPAVKQYIKELIIKNP